MDIIGVSPKSIAFLILEARFYSSLKQDLFLGYECQKRMELGLLDVCYPEDIPVMKSIAEGLGIIIKNFILTSVVGRDRIICWISWSLVSKQGGGILDEILRIIKGRE
ncbi:hypothetical protein CS542_03460 [Pedobacter sp. IW39]|nr:hypothetical protein CS542_03460 [Pedobacter sp. IW39]